MFLINKHKLLIVTIHTSSNNYCYNSTDTIVVTVAIVIQAESVILIIINNSMDGQISLVSGLHAYSLVMLDPTTHC